MRRFIEAEREAMDDHRLAKTRDRCVVGMMTEFAFVSRGYAKSEDAVDLVELLLWPARTPCGPMDSRHGSPDRELAAISPDDAADCSTALRRPDGVCETSVTGWSYDLGTRQRPRRAHG